MLYIFCFIQVPEKQIIRIIQEKISALSVLLDLFTLQNSSW